MDQYTREAVNRQVFHELTQNPEFKNSVISESFLREDMALVNNKSEYLFRFLAETGQADLPERRLSRTDIFIVTAIGLFLINEVDAKRGNAALQTYPNPTVFAAGTPADLEAIYNGALNFQVDNVVILDDYDTQNFRHVGDLLESAGNTKSAKGAFDGMVQLATRFVMDGASKNEFRLEIPTFANIDLDTPTAGETIKVVAKLHGFLIQGAAKGSFYRR